MSLSNRRQARKSKERDVAKDLCKLTLNTFWLCHIFRVAGTKLRHSPHWPSVFACMPSGRGCGSRPLRCLWALESSANHNAPFFVFAATEQLSPPFCPPLVVLQPYLLWDKKERRIWESDRDLISSWQISQRRKRRRIWSRGQTSIFMRHHRLNSAQFKEGGCEVCLSCTAGSDSWAEGYLYASV